MSYLKIVIPGEFIVFEFSNQNRHEDVLVTGIGLVSPLGCSADATWEALIAGRRAGRCLTRNDIDHFDQLSDMHGLALHGTTLDYEVVTSRLECSRLLETVTPDIAAVWRSEPLVAMSLVCLAEAKAREALLLTELGDSHQEPR